MAPLDFVAEPVVRLGRGTLGISPCGCHGHRGRSSALRASLFAFAVHAESASSALAAFRSHEAMLASGASATQITCSLPAAMRTETRPTAFATSAFDASVLAALVDNHGAEDTTEK